MNEKRGRLRIFAFMLAMYIILASSVDAYATALPIWGYMPPSGDQVEEFLMNMYGLFIYTADSVKYTAEQISQGYHNAIDIALDAGADAFESALASIKNSITRERKLTITPQFNAQMNLVLDEILTNGLHVAGEDTAITEKVALCDAIMNYIGYQGYNAQITRNACETVYDSAVNEWGSDSVTALIMQSYNSNVHPNENSAYIFFYNKTWELSFGNNGDEYYYLRNDAPCYCMEVYPGGYDVHPVREIKMTLKSGGYVFRTVNFGHYASDSVIIVGSHSVNNTTAIHNGTEYILTPFTVIDNGVVDTTKDIEVTLPVTFPEASHSVQELDDLWEQTFTEPISETEDATQTVEQLQEQALTQTGALSEYKINLYQFFPFCIPWDIGNLLSAFSAEPETPHFTWTFPAGYDSEKIYIKYADGHSEAFLPENVPASLPSGAKNTGHILFVDKEISLEAFDGVAYYCRLGEKILFVLGLAYVTRSMYIRS